MRAKKVGANAPTFQFQRPSPAWRAPTKIQLFFARMAGSYMGDVRILGF
jgi:hypothetical protein